MIKLSASEKKHVIFEEMFHKKSSKKLCILSHFDLKNTIDNYVCYMIKELYRLNFDVIMVSTSKSISQTKRMKVKKYLRAFVLKQNSGYDFFSWKVGMSLCKDFSLYDEVLLLNDSIFFPLTDPKKIFEQMKLKKYDFWGLLDSYNRRYHIQSFFWFFNKKIKKSTFFSSFWNNVRALDDKIQIINQYETMFTSLVMNSGYRVGSFVETKNVRSVLQREGIFIPKEETLFYSFWHILIVMFNAPLLKKNILCPSHQDFNPLTYSWKYILQYNTHYNSRLISKLLDRCEEKDYECSFDGVDTLKILIRQVMLLKQENCSVVLYGYSYVGKLIHSILKDRVKLIVDRNYKYLNTTNSVEVFPVERMRDITYDKVFVCSFGREEQVLELFHSYGIEDSQIITVSHYINEDPLVFSNFITRLLKLCHGASYSRVLNREVQFYQTDKSIVESINDYLSFVGIKVLQTFNCDKDIEKNQISLIDAKMLKVISI